MSNPTLQEIYQTCVVSNNGTDNPMSFEEFRQAISAAMEAVIGQDVEVPDDIWAEPRPEKVRAQNELRTEQRKRKDTFIGGGNG